MVVPPEIGAQFPLSCLAVRRDHPMEAENPGNLIRQGFPGLVFLPLLLGFGVNGSYSSFERSNPLNCLQLGALPGQRSLEIPLFSCSLWRCCWRYDFRTTVLHSGHSTIVLSRPLHLVTCWEYRPSVISSASFKDGKSHCFHSLEITSSSQHSH